MYTGLFKVEWRGHGFVGLNSKTYYCFHNDEKLDKYSSKGVSKRSKLTKNEYLKVLEKDVKEICHADSDNSEIGSNINNDQNIISKLMQTNRGFIMKNNQLLTYSTSKEGLKNFYCKRILLNDGVSTTFLKI